MALQEDISWQVLRRIVHDWAGAAAELAEVKRLVGGCINTTLSLTTSDGAKAVLKIAPHRVSRDLHREAQQLRFLRECGLPAPEVYAFNLASLENPDSYLLMEFIEGVNLTEARRACTPEEHEDLQRHLAAVVLAMHAHTGPAYRRAGTDNGVSFRSWPEFYRHVYDQIWHEVEKSGQLPVKCRKQIGRVHERLERLLANDDCPRLVHWDIWATNVLARRDHQGRWRIAALLDPNCKFAHAEAELAYMELFHTITPAFTRAYQQTRKLPEAYHRIRKPVYQLYPLINHIRLFGTDYLKPLISAVERTSSIV